jgi:hypothetical protein
MPARDGRIIEAQVGGKASADAHRTLLERDHQRAVGALHFDVAAGLGTIGRLRTLTRALVEALDRVEALGDALGCGMHQRLGSHTGDVNRTCLRQTSKVAKDL